MHSNPLPVAPPRPVPRTDRRLLGIWRSDRRSTVAEWRFPKRLAPGGKRWFFNIFGHLQISYTRTRIRGVFKGIKYVQRHESLTVDSDSVAVRYKDTCLTGKCRIEHIHLEGCDRYWVAQGPKREWFRRIKDGDT